jgi:membrane protease YdiL (CAAX protease family)
MKYFSLSLFSILLLFILPIVLIKLEILPIAWRFPLLYTMVGIVFVIVLSEKWTLKDLGIRLDNIRESMIPYIVFTILGLGFIYLLAVVFDREPALSRFTLEGFSLLFIPISIAQEFIYRSYLLAKLGKLVKSPTIAILLNTALFALLHIIYPNPIMLLPVGIVAGLGFAWIYYRYPNLILISISHMILNYAITSFCFFTITMQSC